MHERNGLAAFWLAAGLALAQGIAAAADTPFTAEQLASRYAEARGGLARLQALQGLRVKGKILVNGGALELGYTETLQRGGKLRDEVSLQGLTQVSATDGSQGWQINPFQGRKDPEKLSEDDSKALNEGSEIDGPLIDTAAKGSVVKYLGTEDVDGTSAHKLEVTRKDGTVQTVFLDPDHFLEIRRLSRRSEHGVEVVTQTDFGEYALVDGLYFPFAIASGPKGSSDPAQTQLESVEVNPKLDATQFTLPAGPAPAGK